jgi:alpha-tubulin suppressor-like RCC1 family protein
VRAILVAALVAGCSLEVKTTLEPCSGGACPTGFACIQDQCVPDQPTGTTCTAAVGAGLEHSCAVRTDGAVFCWGRNDYGQIGNGDTTDQLAPIQVVGGAQGGAFLTNIKSVVGGAQHTCALDKDGGVWCWGKNGDGQLGDNTTTDSKTPVHVLSLSGVTSLYAGFASNCAQVGDSVSCWGYNNQGEIGDTTKTDRPMPTQVVGLSGVVEFALADESACAVRTDGTVWCWGENSSGELGDGTTTQRGMAKPIPGLDGALHVAMTWASGCAATTYGVVCWGNNTEGELGTGSFTDSTVPVFSEVPVTLVSMIGGRAHTCGLTFDGELWCWGNGGDGRFFDGGDDYRPGPVHASVPPVAAVAGGGAFTCVRLETGAIQCAGYNGRGQLGDGKRTSQPQPQVVPMLANVKSVMNSSGGHSCAIMMDGTVSCWGANGDGQLGDGTYVDRGTPAPVPGLSNVTQLDGGYAFTCALLGDGTVWCWGQNDYGALANGNTHHSAVPTRVQGLPGPVRQISAGRLHACAVLTSGPVMCWGYNGDGELGDSTSTERHVATPVMGVTAATAVACGYEQSCAIKADQTVTCWGGNAYGELGNGLTTDSHVPVVTMTVANATEIEAQGLYTCALQGDQSVLCWGYNGDGELGINTTSSHSTPQMVTNGVAHISNGYGHACVLKTNGEVWCWGENGGGEIGDNSYSQRNAPVKVMITGTVSQVAASNTHTCALVNGGLQCWGQDIWGQLGDGVVDWLTIRGVNIPCE